MMHNDTAIYNILKGLKEIIHLDNNNDNNDNNNNNNDKCDLQKQMI